MIVRASVSSIISVNIHFSLVYPSVKKSIVADSACMMIRKKFAYQCILINIIKISSILLNFIETKNAVLDEPIGVLNKIGTAFKTVIAPALTRVKTIADTALLDCIRQAELAPKDIDLNGLLTIFAKNLFN